MKSTGIYRRNRGILASLWLIMLLIFWACDQPAAEQIPNGALGSNREARDEQGAQSFFDRYRHYYTDSTSPRIARLARTEKLLEDEASARVLVQENAERASLRGFRFRYDSHASPSEAADSMPGGKPFAVEVTESADSVFLSFRVNGPPHMGIAADVQRPGNVLDIYAEWLDGFGGEDWVVFDCLLHVEKRGPVLSEVRLNGIAVLRLSDLMRSS